MASRFCGDEEKSEWCLKMSSLLITNADGSWGAEFTPAFVCLSARFLKNRCMQGMIFHRESWKAIYFWIKRSKVKVMTQKKCRRGSSHSCRFLLVLIIRSQRSPTRRPLSTSPPLYSVGHCPVRQCPVLQFQRWRRLRLKRPAWLLTRGRVTRSADRRPGRRLSTASSSVFTVHATADHGRSAARIEPITILK